MTPFLILLINLGATAAMWFELRQALDMRWRTSLAYGLGLAAWWISAVLPAMSIGTFLERYGR